MALHTQQQALISQQPYVTFQHAERLQPNTTHTAPPARAENLLSELCIKDETVNDTQRRHYSYYAPPPMSHTSSLHEYACEAPQMTDLAKYLVRREMVSSGLLKFDDHMENY